MLFLYYLCFAVFASRWIQIIIYKHTLRRCVFFVCGLGLIGFASGGIQLII